MRAQRHQDLIPGSAYTPPSVLDWSRTQYAGAVQPRARAVRSAYERIGKPLMDRVLGLLLLALVSPLLLAVAVAVRWRLGFPVLLRQRRVGLNGQPFPMFKFRTMLPDRRASGPRAVERERRRTHKHPGDPRHTPLGRMLRAYSLDELPQLINVVRGEMSLVGPRPELVELVQRYEPWQHARHAVRPGVTGLFQVTERGQEMHKCTDADLAYIQRLSFATDCKILLQTIPALLALRGH